MKKGGKIILNGESIYILASEQQKNPATRKNHGVVSTFPIKIRSTAKKLDNACEPTHSQKPKYWILNSQFSTHEGPFFNNQRP